MWFFKYKVLYLLIMLIGYTLKYFLVVQKLSDYDYKLESCKSVERQQTSEIQIQHNLKSACLRQFVPPSAL